MYRYIAIVWNNDDSQKAVAQSVAQRLQLCLPSWQCAFSGDSLIVLDANARETGLHAYVLPDQRGVVVGKLFSKRHLDNPAATPVTLDETESRAILKTDGRRLMTEYWGQYVAFLNDIDQQKHHILRDPTSGLPCFRTTYRGLEIFFSYAEDIEISRIIDLTINFKYLYMHLWYNVLSIRETGINEVTEVLAGECIHLGKDKEDREFYWDPRAIASERPIEGREEAAEALRNTTINCVSAWASCYDTIILELSGGLDSSIVLSCLSQVPNRPETVCLNFWTGEPEADERTYARAAAKAAGCDLVEPLIQSPETDIGDLIRIPKLAKPFAMALTPEYEKTFVRVAEETNADAFFNGQGGDHLFHQMKTPRVAADYAQLHGLNPKLFRVAYDTALLTKKSIWSVLRVAIRDGLLRHGYDPRSGLYDRDNFLDDQVIDTLDIEEILNPWLQDAKRVPPAKFQQIKGFSDLQRYNWPYSRTERTDVISPLASQPLMELCLLIPTYTLTAGGQDRGLARYAFRNDVPPEIIGRQTKGRADGYYNKIFSRNQEFIRDLLLHGELVKHNIVDRTKLEKRLSSKEITRAKNLPTIIQYLNVEAWLRSWSDAGQTVAA